MLVLQISVPMSVEFDELAKARENPTEEMASKYISAILTIQYNVLIFVDLVEFSDEEGYGKYLDMHECYEKYINLKGIEVSHVHIEYAVVLGHFFAES